MTVERIDVSPTRINRVRAAIEAPASRIELLEELFEQWELIKVIEADDNPLMTPEGLKRKAQTAFEDMRRLHINYYLANYNGSVDANTELALMVGQYLESEREYAERIFGIDLPDVYLKL